IGRTFSADEERSGSARVVVVSNAFWQDRLGGTRDAIGKTLTIDGRSRVIVGVMPPSFDFPNVLRACVPTVIQLGRHRVGLHPVTGGLEAGVGAQAALAELETFATTMERDVPHTFMKGATSQIIPLKERLVGDVSHSLVVFAGAVALVLLIACANVANL